MDDSFIIFIQNPPSISKLTSLGKQAKWSSIKQELEKLIENYKKYDYFNQEAVLFDIIDKPFPNMSNNHFLKIIKKLIDKIKEEIKEYNLKPEPISFNSSESGMFNITFKNIFSFVNIIIYIIDNITSKGKLYDIIYDFSFKGVMPKFKDSSISNQQLSNLLLKLNSIQTIKINIYKENEDIYSSYNDNKNNNDKNLNPFKMDTKIILLFSLFFNAFFKKINRCIIDLNIPPIDNYFISNINPYLINKTQILNIGNYYKDIILCNLILIKALTKFTFLANYEIKMHDSYQIELHNILTNELDYIDNEIDFSQLKKRSKTLAPPPSTKADRYYSDYVDDKKNILSDKFNNNYLFIQHLLAAPKVEIYEFCLDFNSLDPLLFNSVNYLLTKFSKLSYLKLILFPHNSFNKRKIYLNNIIYNSFSKNDDQYENLYSMDDKKIYYQYIDDNHNNYVDNNYILRDEKLLNELFYRFNMNLRDLSIILEKHTELLELKIDFGTYNNKSISLFNYDNYNCSIVCFIFDLFKTFQAQINKCKINTLEIYYEDFLDEKSFIVETIKRKIPSYGNGFNLNHLKLNCINFNLSNISLFLPFENFPSVGLTELIISNLTYNDLNNLVNAFKKNKNMFPVLIKLDISLTIMVEDYSIPLEILLKECLSQELIYFNMTIPFNISIPQLTNILYWIKCNHNTDTNIYLKIVNSQLSPCINHHYFKNCVVDLLNSHKEYFRKRNLLPDFEILNKNIIKFKINKYDIKDLDYYYTIIYCFNKNRVEIDNEKDKKIFENIFNYKGGFKKYEVEIEVIN